ncbi:DUF2269 domain-containing protein [Streptomyces formicae]|uniref:DUF2269 domain-containing protein n=1 Tax=Streptomyces formicae TaxID=1616117 RepID=A0ABY3WXC0_9ACTN|nr:DUF2269 domain-containing protein [Streptomyces formicae]UNM16211.1 DUF2269 domain-containing protein [Streptomyces formicae]
MKPLKRPARRAILVVHVSASAGWLGLSLGLLGLSVAAVISGSQAVAEASYRSMAVFANWLMVPVALLTLVSGVVLSLGTPWGLARYRWVWTKFWLTLVTTGLTVFSLRPGVNAAAQEAAAGTAVTDASGLLAAPIVSLSAYLFMTAISVLKPWGMTRRGHRLRVSATSGKALDERSLRPTA